jgi:hypothetical protein
MAITQQQAQKFFDWITAQGVDSLRCEFCQNNSFNFDIVATISQHAEGDKVSIGQFDLASQLIPLVLCMCDRCGCTKTFSATKIGLMSEGQGGQAPRFDS